MNSYSAQKVRIVLGAVAGLALLPSSRDAVFRGAYPDGYGEPDSETTK